MFRFNDIFLVIVACYVIYKVGFVDGFTLVNLFIAVCTVVAFVSTILRRSGYMERLKEKENEAVKKREEKKEMDRAKKEQRAEEIKQRNIFMQTAFVRRRFCCQNRKGVCKAFLRVGSVSIFIHRLIMLKCKYNYEI